MNARSVSPAPENAEAASATARAAPRRILATGSVLAAFLCLVRSEEMAGSGGPARKAARLLLSSYDDFAYVACLTAAFLGLVALARRSPRASRNLERGFLALSIVSLVAALANREIVPIFGKPFTYQWLYYSDFLQGQDAKNAIRWFLDVRLVVAWAAVLAAFVAAARVAPRALRRGAPVNGTRAALAAAAAVLLYFAGGAAFFARAGHDWDRARLANPVVVFARSVALAPRLTSLLDARTSVGSSDFEPPAPAAAEGFGGPRAGPNVLVVVLESVGAEYVEAYGGSFPVTPELSARRASAALFRNVYAHSPSTESSMASLLLSLYPWLSYKTLSREHPGLSSPSLADELSRRGYRTAFFNAADLRFAGQGGFLARRGFDAVEDYRSLRCGGEVYRPHDMRFEEYLDGADDACVFDSFAAWAARDARPFFGVVWTMMTHHPYFAPADEAVLDPADANRNRYLNALRHGDAALGATLRKLGRDGLLEKTLVVVLGDHGESFGRHRHQAHGSKIYEEDLHVPLLFLQPGAFRGETVDAVGGMIDVAPTILDALGLQPPAPWQGRSLWRRDRPPRTYFFAPHSNFLVGLRDGDLYFIDDVWQRRFEVYDVARDPAQTRDLAPLLPDRLAVAEQRLAAWAQYQERLYRRLGDRPPGAVRAAR